MLKTKIKLVNTTNASETNSYFKKIDNVFNSNQLSEWYYYLSTTINWDTSQQTGMPRKTKFFCRDKIFYPYGKHVARPNPIPTVVEYMLLFALYALTLIDSKTYGSNLLDIPNSCVINFYDGLNSKCGWHRDDEKEMKRYDNFISILEKFFFEMFVLIPACWFPRFSNVTSMSLGDKRDFEIRRFEKYYDGYDQVFKSFDKQSETLENGALFSMEGKAQLTHQHRVDTPKHDNPSDRINITWRYAI